MKSELIDLGGAALPSRTMQTIRVTAVRTPLQAEPARSDVIEVADLSGSMSGKKLADLQAAARAFSAVKARLDPEGRLGLVSFADDAKVEHDLVAATGLGEIESAIARLKTRGSTDITSGLRLAGSVLLNGAGRGPRYIVLLSDGHHNGGGDPVALSDGLKGSGIVIYGVGFGSNPSDVDCRLPLISSPGKYIFLSDKESLVKHFEFVSHQTSIRSQRA